MTEARLIVTGEAFVGRGHRSIDAVMDCLVGSARSRLDVAIYLFTSTDIVDKITRAVHRGVRVSLLVNDFDGQPGSVRQSLKRLMASFPSFSVYSFTGAKMGPLHAKVIIADRERAIIGSANFTVAAMNTNHEIGMYVEGRLAEEAAELLDSLITRSTSIPR